MGRLITMIGVLNVLGEEKKMTRLSEIKAALGKNRDATYPVDEDDVRYLLDLVEEARAALRECADDLASEVEDRYVHDGQIHPAMQRKYDADMIPVARARAWLEKTGEAT